MIKINVLLPRLLLAVERGVSAFQVVSFNLVDAATNTVVLTDIQDGAVIDKAVYGYVFVSYSYLLVLFVFLWCAG